MERLKIFSQAMLASFPEMHGPQLVIARHSNMDIKGTPHRSPISAG